jgi:hypothetical protein
MYIYIYIYIYTYVYYIYIDTYVYYCILYILYTNQKRKLCLLQKQRTMNVFKNSGHLTSDSETNIAHLHIQSCGPQNTLIKTICD